MLHDTTSEILGQSTRPRLDSTGRTTASHVTMHERAAAVLHVAERWGCTMNGRLVGQWVSYILVGGFKHFLFFHILGEVFRIDFHISQGGSNHSPVYIYIYMYGYTHKSYIYIYILYVYTLYIYMYISYIVYSMYIYIYT